MYLRYLRLLGGARWRRDMATMSMQLQRSDRSAPRLLCPCSLLIIFLCSPDLGFRSAGLITASAAALWKCFPSLNIGDVGSREEAGSGFRVGKGRCSGLRVSGSGQGKKQRNKRLLDTQSPQRDLQLPSAPQRTTTNSGLFSSSTNHP